jgi:signal transduction histidine kinase
MEPIGGVTLAVIVGVGSAILGVVCTLVWARRALDRARAQADQRLDSAPLGLWWRAVTGDWRLSAGGAALLNLDPSIDPTPASVLERLEGTSREALAPATDRLIADGTAFDLSVDLREGARRFDVSGRMRDGEALIWVVDATRAARVDATLAERTAQLTLRDQILQALPWPIWWRGADAQTLAGCNAAFGKTLETTGERALAEGLEIGGERGQELAHRAARTGVAQSESVYVVTDGARRLLDLTEIPIAGDALVGYAQDVSALESMQETLGEHIAAHDEVLERLGAAIAIYAADGRMTFHNTAFLSLWGLPADRLTHSPSLGDVLEMMRERRLLPEMVDFPAFKRQQARLFTSLIEPREELLHLPDERTIRVSMTPHPQGGLFFVYEDVTDRVALERSHNTLTAVQRLTLDSLYEGVAVFGTDGRLRLSNDVFARLFDFDREWLSQESPHIANLADQVRSRLPAVEDWEAEKAKIVTAISEPKSRSGRMELQDGKILDFAYVPLPDGQCLLLYLDVSDTVGVERALKERNAALENADLLKSQFISSISYELRSPLNAIMGFTELLLEQIYGPLNARQVEQMGHIYAATQDLAGLINDVLDLAALQAGYLAIERTVVDLGALMGEVAETGQGVASARGVVLDCTIESNLGMVNADERRLRQSITRVLSSALSYASPKTPVQFYVAVDETGVTVGVTDPGHGLLASEGLIRAGNRAELAGRLTGAGVGLSLCKNLMELHGGSLRVVSHDDDEPGRVVMHLPRDGGAP